MWLGATCAVLAWLGFGALTDLGKVPELLYPIAIGVALTGALVTLTPARQVVWWTTAITIVVFCVVTLTPFVTIALPTKKLVRNDKLPTQALDAVIVLSAGITADSLLMPEPLDRLLTGLSLMRDSVAPVLVVTQPRSTSNGATAAPDQARVRALVSRPFPMLTVDSVHTTRDEAIGAWRMLRPRGATRVAVVTSPMHTSRACATFEHVGFVVTCVSAISRVYSVGRPESGQDRLALFRAWLYELAAWSEYRWRGWVTR
jgi:uncharacterized SAM-binding protein YcdF (DUF218 family)